MYELKEETKELIERIGRLDINVPMCCAILDLAAALDAKQRELDAMGPVIRECRSTHGPGAGWDACERETCDNPKRAIRVVREDCTHAH